MRLSLFAVAALCVSSLIARADTYQQFNIASGANFFLYATGPGTTAGTLGGSFVLDTTTGGVYSSALTFSLDASSFSRPTGEGPFTGASTGGSAGQAYAYKATFSDAANNFLELVFRTTTLVGYAGGQLCPLGGTNPCTEPSMGSAKGVAQSTYLDMNGVDYQLDPSTTGLNLVNAGPLVNPVTTASVTPEPSSFALLGTGLFGVVGVMRKRLA